MEPKDIRPNALKLVKEIYKQLPDGSYHKQRIDVAHAGENLGFDYKTVKRLCAYAVDKQWIENTGGPKHYTVTDQGVDILSRLETALDPDQV